MAQTSLTTLEYAMLGLLSLTPMSGYDVHRRFARTPLAHFSPSPGSIYPALKRLSRRGLVAATVETPTETRPRRVYSLTPAGRMALDAWLRQPVTREELLRTPRAIVLRFSFAEGCLPPQEVIAYLEGYHREVTGFLEELKPYHEKVTSDGGLHQRLSIEHGIQAYEAQLRWIEDAIAAIRGEPGAASGGKG